MVKKLFFTTFLVISLIFGSNGDIVKKTCTEDGDCTDANQACHELSEKVCGTKECQSGIEDCEDIGNLDNGKFVPESCTDNLCVYSPPAVMSSEGEICLRNGLTLDI